MRARVIKGVVVIWCEFRAKTGRIWTGEVKKHSKYSLLGGNRKKWRYENIRLEYAKSLRYSSDGIKNEKGLKIERKYSLLTYLSSPKPILKVMEPPTMIIIKTKSLIPCEI